MIVLKYILAMVIVVTILTVGACIQTWWENRK
jgi:Tfp pilus assembly protein PilX